MRYSLCLFDLDGTLTDSKPGIVNSFRYMLSAFGICLDEDGINKFIGPPLRESLADAYGFSAADVEKAVAKYREYFTETGIFENAVYPGVADMIAALKKEGARLAVATSKAAVYANRILERFGIDMYFDFVSGDALDGSLSGGGKKVIINIALDKLDPNREARAAMIGDRKYDITGGREAGIAGIGITWGYGTRAELEEAGADIIADTPEELRRVITDNSYRH